MKNTLSITLLCALMTCSFAPVHAAKDLAPIFERPEGFRFAINAVIGDISYVATLGELPGPGVNADERVRIHLEYVHSLLASRDVSHLSDQLQETRARHLANLRRYVDAGVFPRNRLYSDQSRPCFIDDEGRVCAVGYLITTSAGREVAEAINAVFQSEFLWRMNDPVVLDWVESSGFSMLELCMIQPGYLPYFDVTVTTSGDNAPARVTIQGEVISFSMNITTRVVTFDFGDGTFWVSPEHAPASSSRIPVNVEHVYVSPGQHTIVGSAISHGGGSRSQTWEVGLGVPYYTIDMVATAAPNEVFLVTSDDIHLAHLSHAHIDWGEGDVPTNAGWYTENGTYRTTAHQYDEPGTRLVTVTNTYQNGTTSYSQQASATINVGPIPISETSWGRIKALYGAR